MQLDIFKYQEQAKKTAFFETIKKCNKALDEVNKEEKKINNIIEKARGNRELTCGNCKTMHRIKNLVYIQTYWYVQPHGCTGGDYWNTGEGYFICPDCNIRNRLLSSNEYSLDYKERDSTKNHLVRFTRYYRSEFKDRIDETKEQEKLRFVIIRIGKDFIVEE